MCINFCVLSLGVQRLVGDLKVGGGGLKRKRVMIHSCRGNLTQVGNQWTEYSMSQVLNKIKP